MAEIEEKLKSLLMKVKEESEKAGFKLNIQKNYNHGIWSHHFMVNRLGEEKETMIDFIFLVSKITADCNFTHKIKRHLFLGRKIMANLVCMCVCAHTCVCTQSLIYVRLFVTPYTIACQVPLSMGFSPQDYWSVGCHFLLQGVFLIQGSDLCLWHFLHWQEESLPLSHWEA